MYKENLKWKKKIDNDSGGYSEINLILYITEKFRNVILFPNLNFAFWNVFKTFKHIK